ncbi:MAG: DUF6273 domain-containing protein [Bacilli bacterium]|nr:DUF6273 domain-containing protein [Bacilli bacterium]
MKKLVFIMPLMAMSLLVSCDKGIDNPIPLNECSWDKINEVSKAGQASKWFKVGDEKAISINGKLHKVRILGFNQDVDNKNNTLGITFEFVNLICDANGNSLAVQWNDDSGDSSNGNYLDSTIRLALNGTGKASQFLWAEKAATTWSKTYKNKTVLDMLPSDLVKVLKEPIKYVACRNNEGKWEDKTFSDKLFLLSPREMGYDSSQQESPDHTRPYSYYEGHTDYMDSLRIKKQINDDEIYIEAPYIPVGSGQLIPGDVQNHAGYVDDHQRTWGATYWLRSPDIGVYEIAWHSFFQGLLSTMVSVRSDALCIAPAFCI